MSNLLSIEAEAQGIRQQLLRQRRRLLDPHAVASRLFRGPDGKLKDDAVAWLERLGRSCFADEPAFDLDGRAHAFNEGKRAAFLEILASLRLPADRLAAIARQLRENDDE